jgi:MoxR-like ATPase
MDITLLFRKHSALAEEGLPWLIGNEEHPYLARRNDTGRANVSAVLVRSLLYCLEGAVLDGYVTSYGVLGSVRSKTSSSVISACWVDGNNYYIPHGEARKVTYHIGILAMLQALAAPAGAQDFLLAYHRLLVDFRKHGASADIRGSLLQAGDELYYFLRYAEMPGEVANDRADTLNVCDASMASLPFSTTTKLNIQAFTDEMVMASLCNPSTSLQIPLPIPQETVRNLQEGFLGWQAAALEEALCSGDNCLLAGPTGTGKTFALQQVALKQQVNLVIVEGKEGMTDLDFLGAILPQEDGARRWVDGPILRALRAAQRESEILFLDELNRIPRAHLNLLIGLMNEKSGAVCRRMGLGVQDNDLYYVIEVPMTSEIVSCPVRNLRFVAAGNFGRSYAVCDLDPALRRRFSTVIEFDYLDFQQEAALLDRETVLEAPAIDALVKLSCETRRMYANGELPGCIDTASLLNWGRKCARHGAESVEGVMRLAALSWADQVCGRDHTGRVNQGAFQALQDYLISIGAFEEGKQ